MPSIVYWDAEQTRAWIEAQCALTENYLAQIPVDFRSPEGSGWCLNQEPVLEKVPACHPFFTGKQKLVDTAGRVEKYRRKYQLEKK